MTDFPRLRAYEGFVSILRYWYLVLVQVLFQLPICLHLLSDLRKLSPHMGNQPGLDLRSLKLNEVFLFDLARVSPPISVGKYRLILVSYDLLELLWNLVEPASLRVVHVRAVLLHQSSLVRDREQFCKPGHSISFSCPAPVLEWIVRLTLTRQFLDLFLFSFTLTDILVLVGVSPGQSIQAMIVFKHSLFVIPNHDLFSAHFIRLFDLDFLVEEGQGDICVKVLEQDIVPDHIVAAFVKQQLTVFPQLLDAWIYHWRLQSFELFGHSLLQTTLGPDALFSNQLLVFLFDLPTLELDVSRCTEFENLLFDTAASRHHNFLHFGDLPAGKL